MGVGFTQELKSVVAPRRTFKVPVELEALSSEDKYVKHRIEEVDEENLVCKYPMIEEDVLVDKLEYIAYEVEFEEASNRGCICKMRRNFHSIGNYEIKEEEIGAGEETVMGKYLDFSF